MKATTATTATAANGYPVSADYAYAPNGRNLARFRQLAQRCRGLRDVTRLWNLADSWAQPEPFWAILADVCAWGFANPADVNSVLFEYDRKPDSRILGSFGKGLDGSVSVNFATSGGCNCDKRCPMHPESTAKNANYACYAVAVENRPDRQPLLVKLVRHEKMNPADVCAAAILEIRYALQRGRQIPWLRVSTAGSLPQPDVARQNPLFFRKLRQLVALAVSAGIPVHIPVETYAKARFYRSIVGDLVTIRESATSADRFIRGRGAMSGTAGRPGTKLRERLAAARQLAARRRQTSGRKCIVCPAVANTFLAKCGAVPKNDRAKCGACRACSLADVDVVYPLH